MDYFDAIHQAVYHYDRFTEYCSVLDHLTDPVEESLLNPSAVLFNPKHEQMHKNKELKHEQTHQQITHNKARQGQRKHVFYNFDNLQC